MGALKDGHMTVEQKEDDKTVNAEVHMSCEEYNHWFGHTMTEMYSTVEWNRKIFQKVTKKMKFC